MFRQRNGWVLMDVVGLLAFLHFHGKCSALCIDTSPRSQVPKGH
jgi:hypothetical protein